MSKKILMVLTSHDRLGETGQKTGFWLEEFAAPYYAFKDAGADVSLASPAGGQPPVDPKSSAADQQTDATRRFNADPQAQAALAHTARLAGLSAANFDAIFYPGGHGPLWDLVSDPNSIALIEAFWRQGKPVGAVCHAPIVLVNAKDDQGEPIVTGRAVTGFTNSEEDAVGLTHVVPHLVEDTLIDRRARFAKTEDFAPFTQIDGRLVTGQNPASSGPTAEALLRAIEDPRA